MGAPGGGGVRGREALLRPLSSAVIDRGEHVAERSEVRVHS
jgi:hypothetical protein